MRSTYRVLAMIVAIGVVLQAAFIAFAMFDVLSTVDEGGVYNGDYNGGQVLHSIFGVAVIPLAGLALLILSFFAKIPGGVKWAAIVFGLIVLQFLLALASFGVPVVGLLHGINALVLAGVAGTAARQAGTSTGSTRTRAPA